MSDHSSIEEAYESIAESLNYLSKKGETLVLMSATPMMNAMVSGFSGGVTWSTESRKWEVYKEGE